MDSIYGTIIRKVQYLPFPTKISSDPPGSPEVTIKALSFIENLNDQSRIADLGCGTGGQTMVLAQQAPGQITGIDLFPDFINLFNHNAAKLNLQDRVKGIVGPMDNPPFQEEELSLIWSEGAIYNIGFERGLTEWRKFLNTGSYVAVTEASWFTDERPAEINDFWVDAYPEIDMIPNNVAVMQKAGILIFYPTEFLRIMILFLNCPLFVQSYFSIFL